MSFLLRILIFTLITISFGCKGGEFLERNELLNIIGTEKTSGAGRLSRL